MNKIHNSFAYRYLDQSIIATSKRIQQDSVTITAISMHDKKKLQKLKQTRHSVVKLSHQ